MSRFFMVQCVYKMFKVKGQQSSSQRDVFTELKLVENHLSVTGDTCSMSLDQIERK